ncbi:MAG: alpha/beta hydrolase [Thermoleophilaceae bacterium]|nr:alpha/beta hydrolase [Thermoleophilaceae bacterium]
MAPGYATFEGHRLAYETYGRGKRAVVLIHGLMMSARMQEPLALALAESGNLAITIDLAGHGKSDRHRDHLYNWDIPRYAAAIDSVLEDLDIAEAVVIGTSLGANIALQMATSNPARVRGLVIEMPALENAMIGGPLFFTPFAALSQWAAPVARVLAGLARLIPERPLPFGALMLLDLVKRDPESTVDVMKGLFYGQIAPTQQQRREIEQPTLVIGHRYDPIHPFNDAKDLAGLIPDARLIVADSIAELRLTPARITGEVTDFVDHCWSPKVVGKNGTGATRKKRRA